jgi:hypothetical protein
LIAFLDHLFTRAASTVACDTTEDAVRNMTTCMPNTRNAMVFKRSEVIMCRNRIQIRTLRDVNVWEMMKASFTTTFNHRENGRLILLPDPVPVKTLLQIASSVTRADTTRVPTLEHLFKQVK